MLSKVVRAVALLEAIRAQIALVLVRGRGQTCNGPPVREPHFVVLRRAVDGGVGSQWNCLARESPQRGGQRWTGHGAHQYGFGKRVYNVLAVWRPAVDRLYWMPRRATMRS